MNSCISSGTTVQEDVDVRGVRRVQLELGCTTQIWIFKESYHSRTCGEWSEEGLGNT